MHSLLLKKALPFTLTLIVGSLTGGLFNFFFGVGGYKPAPARSYFYGYGEGHGRSCRMRARGRYLVAETKPLNILSVPEASLSAGPGEFTWSVGSVTASVTFGADGNVHEVARGSCAAWGGNVVVGNSDAFRVAAPDRVWDAVERAARQIQFEPETVNGLPVTVTREVEIRFMDAE